MATSIMQSFRRIFFRIKQHISIYPTVNRYAVFSGRLHNTWTKDKRCTKPLGTVPLVPVLGFLSFFMKKEDELSDKDKIREVVYKGILAKEQGNVREASQAFHEALNMSTDFLNEKKITKNENLNHKVFIYNQIANLCLETGDWKTAELVFKDTMKLALQLGMPENDNAMIEMSLKLASIYLYSGRTDLGVIGLKHCITEQETKLKAKESLAEQENKQEETEASKEEVVNTKVLLGKAMKHLANHHLQNHDFKGADSLMKKSLEISQETLGNNHDNTFAIMNDLATCHIMLKEYENAEKLLKDGIKLSGKAKSLMQSAFLSNLGALYIRTNRFNEAKKACEQGLKVAEKGNDEFLKGPCKACLERLAQIEAAKKK